MSCFIQEVHRYREHSYDQGLFGGSCRANRNLSSASDLEKILPPRRSQRRLNTFRVTGESGSQTTSPYSSVVTATVVCWGMLLRRESAVKRVGEVDAARSTVDWIRTSSAPLVHR